MPGFVAMLVIEEASKDVVVALTNSTSGFRPGFTDSLLAIAASESRPPVPFDPVACIGPPDLELAGIWYWGPRPYELIVSTDGCVELHGIPYGRDGRFRPNGDGTYTGEWGYFSGERLEVHRRDDGSLSHIDIAFFVFTRTAYDETAEIPGGLDEKGWHTSSERLRPFSAGGQRASLGGRSPPRGGKGGRCSQHR